MACTVTYLGPVNASEGARTSFIVPDALTGEGTLRLIQGQTVEVSPEVLEALKTVAARPDIAPAHRFEFSQPDEPDESEPERSESDPDTDL